MSLSRSDSALGAFYRRMRGRLGGPKAITATAHKIAKIVYNLLKHGKPYVASVQYACKKFHWFYYTNVNNSIE